MRPNGISNTVGNSRGGLHIGFRQNDDKLISPIPGDDINLAKALSKNVRDLHQNLTPHQMTVLVVDQLEMIHIEEDQRDAGAVALAAFNFNIECLIQESEIIKAG